MIETSKYSKEVLFYYLNIFWVFEIWEVLCWWVNERGIYDGIEGYGVCIRLFWNFVGWGRIYGGGVSVMGVGGVGRDF